MHLIIMIILILVFFVVIIMDIMLYDLSALFIYERRSGLVGLLIISNKVQLQSFDL